MAITLVASSGQYLDQNGGTSAPIDTTGADLLVVSASYYTGYGPVFTPSDSKGNTWVPLTARHVSGLTGTRLWYAKNATGGSGHTFTWAAANTWVGITIFAFSGADLAAPFDVENGATTSAFGGTLSAGSITPSVNGCAVVSGHAAGDGTVTASPAGMTAISGGIAAYVIQTTAAAINPAWSWSGGTQGGAVSVAAFKPLAAATPARATQSVVELLSQPTPAARLTQSAVELLSSTTPSVPPAAVGRVTQAVVETLSYLPPSPARLTQLAVEVFTPRAVPVRTTQLAVELFLPRTIPVRLSQAAVEYFQARAATTRLSQVIVELWRFLPPPAPPRHDCPAELPIPVEPPGGSCSAELPVGTPPAGGSCRTDILP